MGELLHNRVRVSVGDDDRVLGIDGGDGGNSVTAMAPNCTLRKG